jgi:hypothetical protein
MTKTKTDQTRQGLIRRVEPAQSNPADQCVALPGLATRCGELQRLIVTSQEHADSLRRTLFPVETDPIGEPDPERTWTVLDLISDCSARMEELSATLAHMAKIST